MAEHERPIDVATGDDIDAILAEEDVVLLEFYTTGCGACDSMEPVLSVLGRQTDATIVTCNPQRDLGLVEAYGVRSVPTLILFVDGEEVERWMEGFVGADELRETIATHAPDAVPAEMA